jgi:hypothetical protein
VLTQIKPQSNEDRNPRRERRLWHDDSLRVGSLGCVQCPERASCGGLEIREPIFDCLDLCCKNPARCDQVCRNHPEFANRVREIGGFKLDDIPRVGTISTPELPSVIPLLFHGSSRALTLDAAAIALPLARMFHRREATARHISHGSLCSAFGIDAKSMIILSGTDCDAPLERWWGFGEKRRRELIRSFRRIGVSFTTTPNYSMFINVPRWDDMHSMKRIAIVHYEFQSEGLPAALHINGRTNTDFRRWTEFLAGRPEISHIAYEFTTGTGWAGRQEAHAAWLSELAAGAGRPLTLVVRGGIEILPILGRAFAHVTVLDTTSFIKTIMRKRASLNGRLDWVSSPTDMGAPIDELFASNVQTVRSWIGRALQPDGSAIH